MNNTPVQREYFFDSIRAWLMLLGIPFHISLIYSSHSWHVNSLEPSWWLTLFNDFIHAFRMQVFFVISGYFSYMLFLRYPLKKWWKVRVERVGIPMLTAIPLLTLPQFIMLQYVNGKAEKLAHPLGLRQIQYSGVGTGFSPVVFTGAGGPDLSGSRAVSLADRPPLSQGIDLW
ncbi:Glucans biosynthesis protein C [Raoultella ornithinolytica]|nr:Glucans biosynthesis protein C [Raoultella ornithinolytica]